MVFNWFWNLFPSNRATCVSCELTFAKEAMKEIWFKYKEEDGSDGTSSIYVCEPCMESVASSIEDEWVGYPDDGIIELDIPND